MLWGIHKKSLGTVPYVKSQLATAVPTFNKSLYTVTFLAEDVCLDFRSCQIESVAHFRTYVNNSVSYVKLNIISNLFL